MKGQTAVSFTWSIRSVLVALALWVGSVEVTEAQWFHGAAYVAAGVSSTSTSDLDDLLQSRGYPAFGGSAVSIGIGGYATVAGRVLLGGEWTGFVKDGREHDGRDLWLGGGHGTLGAGYVFDVSRRARIYPRVGFGAGGLGLTFESAEDTAGFDEVLADPDAQAELSRGFQPTLTRGHAVVDVGAGAEFMPSRNGRGTLVGLRVGYLFAPSSTAWELNHRAVRDGPAATGAGPYMRMVIGAGSWR